jgi:5-formyltetrahydrofolate cyclo-ligase
MDPAEKQFRQRAKVVMRRRARSLRASLPARACAARSERIRDQLLAQPSFADAASVALFWPIERHNEVDLRPLFDDLQARFGRVAFPALDPHERGNMSFRWVRDRSELAERGRGFMEPAPEAELADALDVIVVPGLLFDARGHRLGYGAGYYDRTLPRFCPPAVAIGVAYDFQLAVDVPTTDDDFAIDWVVTDARLVECKPAAATSR